MQNIIPQEIEISVRKEIEKTNDEIKKEMEKPSPDRHRILRLKEQELLQGMFSGGPMTGVFERFKQPY
jgi:hypothetical protein